MSATSEKLVDLALQMRLGWHETVALPTVIEVAARKAGMSEADMIAECFSNRPLRDYLFTICKKGAEAL